MKRPNYIPSAVPVGRWNQHTRQRITLTCLACTFLIANRPVANGAQENLGSIASWMLVSTFAACVFSSVLPKVFDRIVILGLHASVQFVFDCEQ